MNKQHAIEFINAMNAIQPYVPPMLFNVILNSEVARLAIGVANDQATCAVLPKANGASMPEQAARQ